LLFMLFITLFSSCKKEDENEPTNLLTAKTWTPGLIDKNTSTNPSGRIIYNAVLNCQKDDSYRFSSNGTLTINQGTEKCNNNESVAKTVSYTYNQDTKELIIDGIRYTLAEESTSQIKYYTLINPSTGYDYMVFLLE